MLPESEVQRVYPSYRWRAMETTFIGYAMFYLVRNNVSTVTIELEQALHYDKQMLGNLTAATAMSYGLSKFVMGAVSDRSDARKFISAGLFLTAICNFAFGATSSYGTHLVLWMLNGFVQGMGWPPCGRIMGHWFSERERGLTFSIWNTSHNIGGGLAGVLAAWSVNHFGGWQYAFYVPGAIALTGACYLAWRVRDTPQAVGLPPIEAYRDDYPRGDELTGAPPATPAELERELSFRELMLDKVLTNKWVWLLAIANFFTYITRYSMLDWGPTYLREMKGATLAGGGSAVMYLEFAGIASTIVTGWLSDRAGGRRGMVAALCMLPIVGAFAGIIATPPGYLWVDMCLLGMIGFFVYPVVNLITVAALDIVSKKAIGAAAGFIGLFGYVGRTVQASGFGWTLKNVSQSHGEDVAWNAVLYMILVCAVAATALLSITWRMRPQA